jgi:hypothetical protein
MSACGLVSEPWPRRRHRRYKPKRLRLRVLAVKGRLVRGAACGSRSPSDGLAREDHYQGHHLHVPARLTSWNPTGTSKENTRDRGIPPIRRDSR